MCRFLFILLLFVIKCNAKCTEEEDYIQCDSIQDVTEAEDHKNWTRLYVKNYGKQPIEADFLKQLPLVRELTFENSKIYIQNNSFAEGLRSLSDLTFLKSDLPVIKKNWFSNSKLVGLRISDCNVTSLEERSFDGLTRLTIEDNNIPQIKTNVFNGSSIKILLLDNNRIRFIDENAFANMTKLLSLSLESNFLTSFNSRLIAGPQKNPNVEGLFLDSNQIKYLDKDSFYTFPNLEDIWIGSNELQLIEEGTFSDLKKLETLDLNLNKLKSFSGGVLPKNGLPLLQELYLNKNLLNYLPLNFFRYFPKLNRISILENPWQCPCFEQIKGTLMAYHENVTNLCSEEYAKGERPICVKTNSDECIENIKNYDELSRNFVNRLFEYSEWNSTIC